MYVYTYNTYNTYVMYILYIYIYMYTCMYTCVTCREPGRRSTQSGLFHHHCTLPSLSPLALHGTDSPRYMYVCTCTYMYVCTCTCMQLNCFSKNTPHHWDQASLERCPLFRGKIIIHVYSLIPLCD